MCLQAPLVLRRDCFLHRVCLRHRVDRVQIWMQEPQGTAENRELQSWRRGRQCTRACARVCARVRATGVSPAIVLAGFVSYCLGLDAQLPRYTFAPPCTRNAPPCLRNAGVEVSSVGVDACCVCRFMCYWTMQSYAGLVANSTKRPTSASPNLWYVDVHRTNPCHPGYFTLQFRSSAPF